MNTSIRFVLFSASLLIACSDPKPTNNYIDSSLDMRTPVPVIVDAPQVIALPQSACVIIIRTHDWVFVMNQDSTECRTAKEFHDFIEKKGGRSLNGNVALQTESDLLSQIDNTIALLKQDSIVKFHLITDLHK